MRRCLKSVDERRRRTTTDGQLSLAYAISSPNEPKGSGELITRHDYYYNLKCIKSNI